MARKLWTESELVEVLKLYCRTPFGRLHSRNPDIVGLAERLGRTPSAVALKLVNFASLDPTIDRKGMSNTSDLDKAVWREFFDNMDKFVDETPAIDDSGLSDQQQADYIAAERIGRDVLRLVKTRANQDFFREMIVASYEGRCAVTNIQDSRLLVASHIVPWRDDVSLRTNPCNGVCLNALHDRAFDSHLISFAEDRSILFSQRLTQPTRALMQEMGGQELKLPTRFLPNPDYLARHRNRFIELDNAAR